MRGYISRILKNCKTEKMKTERRKEEKIQELWGNYKSCDIHIRRISEGEKREKETEEMLEKNND